MFALHQKLSWWTLAGDNTTSAVGGPLVLPPPNELPPHNLGRRRLTL